MSIAMPSTIHHILDASLLNGGLGAANATIDGAAYALLHAEEHPSLFSLEAHTPAEAFTQTLKAFTCGTACAGAAIIDVSMLPYDLLVGRGDAIPTFGCYGAKASSIFHEEDGLPHPDMGPILKSEGLIGNISNLFSAAIAGSGWLIGAGTGAIIGAIDYPINYIRQLPPSDWFTDHAMFASQTLCSIIAMGIGIPFNLMQDALRLVSIGVKYTVMGVMGLLGGVIGLFAAAGRSIAALCTPQTQQGDLGRYHKA